ncbi:unnamed protein product [Prunus armeniaca]
MLERLGVPSKPYEEKNQQELKSRVHVDSIEDNEILSLILSPMKRHSTLEKTLSQQNKSDNEEAEVLAVHHVTINELDEEEPFEDEVHNAHATLEDWGQATVDELKELNLGTNEDPRPIFVSALLNPNEEESYHQLLLELRHYMQAFTVHLIARADPVRYVMSKPVLTGCLAKWALLLNQYEIIYTPVKAFKGQTIADFLPDHLIPADWKISDDLPDEQVFFTEISPAWMMFFG